MKVVVLRSHQRRGETSIANEYAQVFDGHYAERVIGNLRDADGFCTACGPACIDCRRAYQRRFGQDIAAVVDFPARLPALLENPRDQVPELPRHDILLAINIHEQLLLEVLSRSRQWGTQAVIVPREAPDWIHGSTITTAMALGKTNEIEIAFPKPFCSFNPPPGSRLRDFKDYFHIGYPRVELTLENRKITRAWVHSSAPCGATYFIARWLVGKSLDDDLKFEIISKKWHCYPCTASMKYDNEIGDSILHLAGKYHFSILDPFAENPIEKHDQPVFFAPLGQLLPAPVSLQENVRNLEQAKKVVLAELERQATVSLQQLRAMPTVTAAALNAALLALKQEGKIMSRCQGGAQAGESAGDLLISRP
jgi:hypothetical protein